VLEGRKEGRKEGKERGERERGKKKKRTKVFLPSSILLRFLTQPFLFDQFDYEVQI
jgi:hypothetical protein